MKKKETGSDFLRRRCQRDHFRITKMATPPAAPVAPANVIVPPIVLRHNLNQVPTLPCVSCQRNVKADFSPVYCHSHRNNLDPTCGWAFITRDEKQLLNILRRTDWTAEALQELVDLDISRNLEQITLSDTRSRAAPTMRSPTNELFTPDESGEESKSDNAVMYSTSTSGDEL